MKTFIPALAMWMAAIISGGAADPPSYPGYPPKLPPSLQVNLASIDAPAERFAMLRPFLTDPREEVRVATMFAVAQVGSREAIDLLLTVVTVRYVVKVEEKEVTLSPAHEALVSIGDPVVAPVLAFIEKESDPKVLAEAVGVLLDLKSDADMQKLVQANRKSPKIYGVLNAFGSRS